MARTKQNFALGLTLACSVAAACGGQSVERHSSDDGAGGIGSSKGGSIPGGTGGTASGGTTGAVSGATTTGGMASGGTGLGGSAGVSATGGAAGEPDFCFLPAEVGTCRGALTRYAFDSKTNLCLPFTYGGCGGNANNFETVENCYATCIGDFPERTFCDTPFDCTLVPSRCCGTSCDLASLGNVVAVNQNHTGTVYDAMGCATLHCVPCQPAPNAWLFATCENHRCVAVDASQSELTACSEDTDCRLRAGLACCEDCAADPDDFVPVNVHFDTWSLLCGGADIGCDACVPTPPANLSTACIGGRCLLGQSIE